MMRFAESQDLPTVTTMLRRFLVEQEKAGSPVQATHRTIHEYTELARSYLRGSLFGVVVIDRAPGFVMAGEDIGLPRLDTTLGKVAVVWSVWVTPPHRNTDIALQMLLFGRPRLLELGFQTAHMAVREDNPAGQALTLRFGAHPVERVYQFTLKEEPHGQRQ